MANISDQLAADIHTAFARYEVDTGNQQQFLFGPRKGPFLFPGKIIQEELYYGDV